MSNVQGITTRVKPKNEIWYLRIHNHNVLEIKTISKRERNILSAIRKIILCHNFSQDQIQLTNRKKYIKNLNVSQNKLLKMKSNNKFLQRDIINVQEANK